MTECDYCGKKIDGVLPHKCKFCGQIHCHNHLLPESHECIGLEHYKQRNAERWKKGIHDSFVGHSVSHETHHEEEEEPQEQRRVKQSKISHKKLKFSERLKNYGLEKYEGLKYWLKKREHYRYDYESRANYLITTILIFAASVVGIAIFYSNASKLNEVGLWIIKLGGVLILTSLFFAIKFGWRLGKEIINVFKRQRNWFRYLVIILIIILLWQGYTHKDDVLNPVFEAYNKTNFTLFAPIGLGNFSLESIDGPSSSSSSNKGNGGSSFISDIGNAFKSEPERKNECMNTFNTLNQVRSENGKRTIDWDDRAYNLAVARSKDMYDRNYFDHVTPEGKCADDFKRDYGFSSSEFLAENAGGMSYYSKGSVAGDCNEALDGWLDSRGHRYNILYDTHKSGAIGCYYEICVFFGVNRDGFGAKPCNTGDEGMAYWQTAPHQPDEV